MFEEHDGEFIIYFRFPNEKKYSSKVFIIVPNATQFTEKEHGKAAIAH